MPYNIRILQEGPRTFTMDLSLALQRFVPNRDQVLYGLNQFDIYFTECCLGDDFLRHGI